MKPILCRSCLIVIEELISNMDLNRIFQQTCEILITDANAYGDQVETDREESICWFRESTQAQDVGNRESISSGDALLRLPADAPVTEGSLIYIEDRYWRISKLIKARRFSSDVVMLKCQLQKHNGPVAGEELS